MISCEFHISCSTDVSLSEPMDFPRNPRKSWEVFEPWSRQRLSFQRVVQIAIGRHVPPSISSVAFRSVVWGSGEMVRISRTEARKAQRWKGKEYGDWSIQNSTVLQLRCGHLDFCMMSKCQHPRNLDWNHDCNIIWHYHPLFKTAPVG